MFFVWTSAGLNFIAANPSTPPPFDNYRIGSAFGYTPDFSQTTLRGAVVYSGVPTAPAVVNDTVYQISFVLDRTLPALSFGEVGLYVSGVLFAVASALTAYSKAATDLLTFDAFLDTTGTTYLLYAQVSATANSFSVPYGGTVDGLPPAESSASNVMLVQSPVSVLRSVLATAMSGAWSVSGYDTVKNSGTIGTLTASLDLPVTLWVDPSALPIVEYVGQMLIQFRTGPARGVLRVVRSINAAVGSAAGSVTINASFLGGNSPVAGDTFDIVSHSGGLAADAAFQRQLLDESGAIIPGGTRIATLSQLYGILANYQGSGSTGFTDVFGNPISV
jgi:hypothetical protein